MVLLHKIRGRHAKLTLKRFGKRRMGAEPALIGYLRYRIKTFLLRIGKEGIESINAHAMYIADQSEAWPGSFQSNLPKISKSSTPTPELSLSRIPDGIDKVGNPGRFSRQCQEMKKRIQGYVS